MAASSSSQHRTSWDVAPQASQSLFPAAKKGFALVEEGICRVMGTESTLPVPARISALGPAQPGRWVGGLRLRLAGF